MIKGIPAAIAAICAVMILTAGEEVRLGEKDFRLGHFVDGGAEVDVSFNDGVFTVDIPAQPGLSNATRGAVFMLPLKSLLGKGLQIRGEVRYDGIVCEPGNPHAGGKILAYNGRDGNKNFFVSPVLRGTCRQWQPISLYCDFPDGIDEGQIVLGIQQGWGRLQFRNVAIEEFPVTAFTDVQLPEGFKCSYTSRVAANSPRRGVMSPPWSRFGEADVRELAKWGVNLVRYQIVDGCPDVTDIDGYRQWFSRALDHLESLMPLLEQHGIQVIVDMHHVIGGRCRGKVDGEGNPLDPSHFQIMENDRYRDAFIGIWQQTARRFKGNRLIYAYDLCNEPIQHGRARHSFWQVQYAAARAIREIDPEVPVMVEGNHMANPVFFEMAPMPLDNIIYSIHMYAPGEYTHQGVSDLSYVKTFYSSRYDYRDAGWDRARLAQSMAAVRRFERQYGARIQVGEFSVAVWAPGGAAYLDDLVSIFEEYGWDWTYHAFREWEGWSLEHEGTPDAITRAAAPTDRLKVMLKYFSRNKK